MINTIKNTIKIMLIVLISIILYGCFGSGCGGLDTPDNAIYNGTKITWDAVDGAESYIIKINETTYTSYSNSFEYNAKNQSFTLTIIAVKGEEQSKELKKSITYLDTIESLKVNTNNKSVEWDPVTKADGYNIKVDGDVLSTMITKESYNDFTPGEYKIQVKPVLKDETSYYSYWSEEITITLLKSIDYKTIKYENGMITWNSIPNNKGYNLYINGTKINEVITDESYFYDSKNNDISIQIMALGDNLTICNSELSEPKEYIYLDTVTDVKIEDGILKWNKVDKANAYNIKIDGNLVNENIETNEYSNLPTNTNFKVEILPIIYKNDHIEYVSNWTAGNNFYILPEPILKWNDSYDVSSGEIQAIYWDSISGASGYEYTLSYEGNFKKSSELSVDTVYITEDFSKVGKYEIRVRTLGDGGQKSHSKYSNPIEIIKLPSPTTSSFKISSDYKNLANGFNITFEPIVGAIKYELYKDRNLIQETSNTQFQVTDLNDEDVVLEKQIEFGIKAIGKYYDLGITKQVVLSSDISPFNITILQKPANLSFDSTILNFDKINNVQSYVVDVNGSSNFVSNNTFNLDYLEAGEHLVKVCSQGNGSSILPSPYTESINVIRLNEPKNIKIGIGNDEGIIKFEGDNRSESYTMIVNSEKEPQKVVNGTTKVSNLISVNGTSLYVISNASKNLNTEKTYYMDSKPSKTSTFIKLQNPSFGEVAFTNSQFIWNHPSNINTSIYTPTYEVYDEYGSLYNGTKTGTKIDISYLKAGDYSFKVKAIGDGITYINSDFSDIRRIKKLDTPTIKYDAENKQYMWSYIKNATSYALYIDGELKHTIKDQNNTSYKYTYKPEFKELKTYNIVLRAIGDGGYTTIDSDDYLYKQLTDQLSKPNYEVSYSHDEYDEEGKIIINITKESPNALEYGYIIGSTSHIISEKSFEMNPNTYGEIETGVYAVGGFNEDGSIYYLDSSKTINNSIILLPQVYDIKHDFYGQVSWKSSSGAIKYMLEIKIGEDETYTVEVLDTHYDIPNYESITNGVQIKVTIKSIGNNNNIISSQNTLYEFIKS